MDMPTMAPVRGPADATLEGEYELPRMGDSSHPLVSALRVELLKSFDYV